MVRASVATDPYELFLPKDWELTRQGSVVGAYLASENTAVLTMAVYPLADGEDAASFWAACDEAYAQNWEGYAFLESGESKLGELAATQYLFRVERGGKTLKLQQTVAEANGAVYVLTYQAEDRVFGDHTEDVLAVRTYFALQDAAAGEPVAPVTEGAPTGMQLASTDAESYRFYVPLDWALTGNETPGAYCKEDRANVSVTAYYSKSGDTLESYLADCRDEYARILTDFTMQETVDPTNDAVRIPGEETTLGGLPARSVTYRGLMGGQAYCFRAVTVNYSGYYYTVTYTAAEAHYEEHLDEFQQILNAFVFR
jgi:hypothetical protein